MRGFFTCVVCALFPVFHLHADFVDPSQYQYPIHDPSEATLGSAFLHGEGKYVSRIPVFIRNSVGKRRLPRGLGKLRDLHTLFYPDLELHDGPKELVFVLTGLGGDVDSGISNYIATVVQKAGKAAVILPNPFTENFVVSASIKFVAGDSRQDAKEIYIAMYKVLRKLESIGYSFNKYSLVGFSHGGLMGAFVADLDLQEHWVGLDSTLLINPPIDVLYSIRAVDRKVARYERADLAKLVDLVFIARRFSSLLSKLPIGDMLFKEFNNLYDLSRNDADIAIGFAFQESLASYVLASQDVSDLGILPPRGPEDSPLAQQQNLMRAQIAGVYSFEKYAKVFLSTLSGISPRRFDLAQENIDSSLPALADTLRRAPIYVMHNADDFLIEPEQLRWLDGLLGQRAKIYPLGGHMGNLGYSQNTADLKAWLQNGHFL